MANFCANCGKALMKKMRFCPYCGASTAEEAYAGAPDRPAPSGGRETDEAQAFGISSQGGAQTPYGAGFGSGSPNGVGLGGAPLSQGTAMGHPFYMSSVGMGQFVRYVPDKGLREMFFRFSGRLNRKRYIFRELIVMGLLLLMQAIAQALKLFVTVPEALQQVYRTGGAEPFVLLAARPIGEMDLRSLYILLGIAVLLLIMTLVFAVAAISCHVRRLHDMDYSGWMYLVMLIPIVDVVLLLAMIFKKGTVGPNRFGPDPLG